MKNVFFFSVTALIFLLAGFQKSTRISNFSDPGDLALVCPVQNYSPSAKSFIASPYVPSAVMIRKDVYSLSAAEINSLKTGIAAMKALPVTNPTSWLYQAAIHGTTLANNLPSWNSCQHGTQFFLSWHRMYLYFFERILRAKSGNPNLTLPYWNYQVNPAIHPDYRNSASTNTLYDGSRNASLNAGGSLGPGPMTAINNALTDIPFFDFSSDLEGPHGSIHVAIGGNMGSVSTAAKDPVFWLHHANIDRLWEEWLRRCGGRSNPNATTNAPWLNQSFTFFDENGAAVNMTGSQILNTSSQLNYRYDFKLMLPCNFILKWWEWRWKWWELLVIPRIIRINDNIIRIPFKEAQTDNLKKFLAETKVQKLRISNTGISDKLFLELENLKMLKAPEGSLEVYMNLKPGEIPNPKSRSFAGVVDLFTASGHMQHTNNRNVTRVNITAAMQALDLNVADLQKVELSFVFRSNGLQGREFRTVGDVEISAVRFAVELAEKQ